MELIKQSKEQDKTARSAQAHVPANLVRKLCEGVGAWLHFEYLCRRDGLFSEQYLSVPVCQILSSALGDRIHSEFEHPILSRAMDGAGRRPSIDFVFCDPHPSIRVAVETKWAGSSHTTAASIIWDLIRLELIAHHFKATCIFLLAGRQSDLDALFADSDFAGPPRTPSRHPILRVNSDSLSNLSIGAHTHYRIPLLRSVLERCQDVAVPREILTRRSKPFPAECKNKNYQVFAWEVLSAEKREEFIPSESRYFKVLT